MSQNTVADQPAEDPYLYRAVRQFVGVLDGEELRSAEEIRKAFITIQSAVEVDLSGIEESSTAVPCDGVEVWLNIVRPMGLAGVLPVFLFIPGGGWVMADYPTHRRMVRDLVVRSGCAAVFINYSRSPGVKYPQALNEIHVIAKWVSEHGEKIGVNPDKIGIVGNGVGATMSAAACLMAKANGGPEFRVQILLWPAASAEFATESWKQLGGFLSAPLMKWMWDQYTTDRAQRREIYASPLLATPEQLKGLPPTLIIVAENDILRDEGEALGRALDGAGVRVTTVRYNGVIHDFGLLNGLAGLPQTRSLFLQAGVELRRYLG